MKRLLIIAGLALLLVSSNAWGYSGSCGIWVTRAGDFLSNNFAGTQAGLNAANSYLAAGGYGQLGPGGEDLVMPAYTSGVAWFRRRGGLYQFWGPPFEAAPRGITTFRADSAGVWIRGDATGVSPRGLSMYGSIGRWQFTSGGASLRDSTATSSIQNDMSGGTMDLGVSGHANAVHIASTGALTTNGDHTIAGTFATKVCPVSISSSTTIDLPGVGTGNIYNVIIGSAATTTRINPAPAGTTVKLWTTAVWTLKDGDDMEINGDFVGDGVNNRDSITITSDGTVWHEDGRSFN